uniref:Uncharacterized protein n=1 Tax=Rhizophagus irregularis (strain DAOM 181602 / DAOM 197198 / MUCL 43194) TaxID=747089 RepID=U9UHA2_RHIID
MKGLKTPVLESTDSPTQRTKSHGNIVNKTQRTSGNQQISKNSKKTKSEKPKKQD